LRVIVIHLGKTIPDYVLINLENLAKIFDKKVLFISDNQRALDEADRRGISTYSHINESSYSNFEVIIKNTDKLLKASILRFQILKEVIEKLQCPIIYLESDVLVFENFPLSDFEKIKNDLAYPVVSNGAGIASVFYVKNYGACKKLIDFFVSELSNDGFLTDMDLLWRYKILYSERVFVLPTTLEQLYSDSESPDIKVLSEMKLKMDFFPGIFDSATWGQFLTGEHEVNSLGFRPIFHQQRHHFVQPWSHKIELNSKGLIEVSLHDEKVPLYCLHVHSKDLSYFGSKKFFSLKESVELSKHGMRFKFSPSIRSLKNFRGGMRNLSKLLSDRWLTRIQNEHQKAI
jgi:hypothetical protein